MTQPCGKIADHAQPVCTESPGQVRFPAPLIPAILLHRYKRFLADVQLEDGREITVHCPNPGAMLGLNQPGLPVWISDSGNPARKLRHTLELVEIEGRLVGINTGWPNRIAEAAIRAGLIPALALQPGDRLRREVRYGTNSRIDLLIEPDKTDAPATFIEVKNVHLRRPEIADGRLAEFPDCRTARGAKHLHELAAQVGAGQRAVMLYIIQRMDCDRFGLAADLDPDYAEAFSAAANAGVETLAYSCDIGLTGIRLAGPLPIVTT